MPKFHIVMLLKHIVAMTKAMTLCLALFERSARSLNLQGHL